MLCQQLQLLTWGWESNPLPPEMSPSCRDALGASLINPEAGLNEFFPGLT